MSPNPLKTKHIILASGIVPEIGPKLLNSGDNCFDPTNVFLGRTLIDWQICSVYNEETRDSINIVVDKSNHRLIKIIESLIVKYAGIKIVTISSSTNIFESLLAGLGEDEIVRYVEVIFSDVLVFNYTSELNDEIVISDEAFIPKFWSYIKKEKDGSLRVIDFPDHLTNLESMNVMIGRYRFSDIQVLKEILQKSKLHTGDLFSSLLLEYHSRKDLSLSSVPPGNWFDFGHTSEVKLGLKKILGSRYFNRVEVDSERGVVTKISANIDKLEDEKLWYLEMKNLIPVNIPRLYGFENHGSFARLELEFIPGRNLAELSLDKDKKSIREILDGEILNLLHVFAQNASYDITANKLASEMYYLKTENRLQALIEKGDRKVVDLILNGVELNSKEFPPILVFLKSMHQQISELSSTALLGPIHGDLCFSNIIVGEKNGKVSLVDPRGRFGQKSASIYGDLRYDLAKLRHSYVSGYDLIKSGVRPFVLEGTRYKRSHLSLIPLDNALHFESIMSRLNFKIEEVELIESLLFLSMLPLHNDEPKEQVQMLLTALEIMAKFSNIMR